MVPWKPSLYRVEDYNDGCQMLRHVITDFALANGVDSPTDIEQLYAAMLQRCGGTNVEITKITSGMKPYVGMGVPDFVAWVRRKDDGYQFDRPLFVQIKTHSVDAGWVVPSVHVVHRQPISVLPVSEAIETETAPEPPKLARRMILLLPGTRAFRKEVLDTLDDEFDEYVANEGLTFARIQYFVQACYHLWEPLGKVAKAAAKLAIVHKIAEALWKLLSHVKLH